MTFLVTSVYFFNPAPFIAKCLELFLWTPSANVKSLCQRLAGSFCNLERTRHKYEKASHLVSKDRKETFDSVLKDCGLFSSDRIGIISFLHMKKVAPANDIELDYCQLFIRIDEKVKFINCFSGKTSSEFLDFLAKLFPPLIKDLQKAGSLSGLISNFFKLMNQVVDNGYRLKGENEPDYKRINQEVMEDITNDIAKFIQYFYPFLKSAGKLHGTKKSLDALNYLLDMIIGGIMTLNYTDEQIHSFASDLMQVIDNEIEKLDSEQQKELYNYLDSVMKLDQSSLDERCWPKSEIVTEILSSSLSEFFKKYTV